MKKEPENPLFAISPQRFFETVWEIKPLGKKLMARGHLLRDELGMEDGIILVYGARKEDSLLFHIEGDLSYQGDGIEIFLDSRPGTSQVVGRFCHKFVFANDKTPPFREETPFRTPEESHPLADPKLLAWEPRDGGVELTIPFEAIHGFSESMRHLGFVMRVQSSGKKQHLGISAREGGFELHPALWSKLTLE